MTAKWLNAPVMFSVVACCCLSLFATTAKSESKVAVSNVFYMSLQDLLQVEITGSTNSPETLAEVPSAVSIFTHSDIAAMGLSTLDQLVGFVPGYQSNRNGGSSSFTPISARSRRINGSSSEILVLVDGLRIDDPRSSGMGNIVPKFPLDYIERVEFIRGPGSALYGSNAMQGVINIITRQGVREFVAEAGSFGHVKSSLGYSGEKGEFTFSAFVQAQDDSGDSYRLVNPRFGGLQTTKDPQKRQNIHLKSQWRNTQLSFQQYGFASRDFYELGRVANDINRRSGYFKAISLDQTFHWWDVTSTLSASYRQTSSKTRLELRPAGSLFDISRPQSNEPAVGIGLPSKHEESRVLLRSVWVLGSGQNLQWGLDFRRINTEDLLGATNYDLQALLANDTPIDYYGDLRFVRSSQLASERDIYGAYLQYQWRLAEQTELTLGVRNDAFSSIGSHVSPRLSLVQGLGLNSTLKLLYSEAFRAPGENELNLVNNPFFMGNPDLKSETMRAVDILWLGQWQKMSVSLGYFQHHFKRAIVRAGLDDGTLQFMNRAQSPVKGLELEWAYEALDDFILRGNVTHTLEKPNSAFREARSLASVIANYRQGRWNTNVALSWHGKSQMRTGGIQRAKKWLDDYFYLATKLTYKASPQWQFYWQCNNALDSEISSPPASVRLAQGIPNRGFNTQVGLTLNF